MLRRTVLAAASLPFASTARAQGSAVPLVTGLAVVTALHVPGIGDYESVKRLEARTAAGWRIGYRASLPPARPGGPAERVAGVRLQADADLATATTYRSLFEDGSEETFPGSTALGVSTAVLRALRADGKAALVLAEAPAWLRGSSGGGGALDLAQWLAAPELLLRGELRSPAVPAAQRSVLVNGQPRSVAVRIAEGRLAARNGQALAVRLELLDDDANPLALAWRIGTAELTVVRIDWPQPDAAAALAATLRQARRVVLPNLHFDFGLATLQPGAESTLAACIQVLRAQAGPVRIDGHTDGIGADAANRALSLARAQAVRAALVARDAALAARLDAQGHGAAQPVADNATPEGRARNRRVELVLTG